MQLRTLHGGRQEGVQVIEVDNGAMTLHHRADARLRSLESQAGDLRLGWDSPVKEIIHPSYIRLTDNGGQGWVAGFGGLMVRGGLASFGSPVQDGAQQLTLHGHVDYIPASHVSVRYEATPVPRLVFRGVVNDVQTFGPQLRLTSEISTVIGKPEFVFDDTDHQPVGCAAGNAASLSHQFRHADPGCGRGVRGAGQTSGADESGLRRRRPDGLEPL